MPFLDGIRYSAVLDSRTTPVCRYLHERIFRPEDIQLTGLIPPNHFNCRSLVVPIIVGELSKPPDYKVDPKVYITDEEILHAQALADAKFLEQEDYLTANDDVHSDGPSADVEEDGIEHCDFASWDESKHPREPGGSGKGGEFTSSGIPGANGDVPPEAGTVPIPEGHVRLYHQTTEENLLSIAKNGLTIEYAKGIEGPRAVYAGETPFYGKVETTPTLEFHVPKNKWQPPFVLQDVPPENMIAVHLPWHRQARYIIEDVDGIKNTLAGKFDYLLKPRSGVGETVQEADDEFAKAVRYIKKKYAGNLSG